MKQRLLAHRPRGRSMCCCISVGREAGMVYRHTHTHTQTHTHKHTHTHVHIYVVMSESAARAGITVPPGPSEFWVDFENCAPILFFVASNRIFKAIPNEDALHFVDADEICTPRLKETSLLRPLYLSSFLYTYLPTVPTYHTYHTYLPYLPYIPYLPYLPYLPAYYYYQ